MAFSNAQLQQLWIASGGNPVAAKVAAAVALAESGGDPNASNRNSNGSIDRGLWQINSVHGAQSTFDVGGNVKAAISISANGTNWNPWTTYKSGAYRKFLSGEGPATGPLPGNADAAAGAGGSSVDLGFGSILAKLIDPHTWFRGAMFFLGLILLFKGIEEISGLKPVIDDVKAKATSGALKVAEVAAL